MGLTQSRPRSVNLPEVASVFLRSGSEEPFEVGVSLHEVTSSERAMVVVDLQSQVSRLVTSFPAQNLKQSADAIVIMAALLKLASHLGKFGKQPRVSLFANQPLTLKLARPWIKIKSHSLAS